MVNAKVTISRIRENFFTRTNTPLQCIGHEFYSVEPVQAQTPNATAQAIVRIATADVPQSN